MVAKIKNQDSCCIKNGVKRTCCRHRDLEGKLQNQPFQDVRVKSFNHPSKNPQHSIPPPVYADGEERNLGQSCSIEKRCLSSTLTTHYAHMEANRGVCVCARVCRLLFVSLWMLMVFINNHNSATFSWLCILVDGFNSSWLLSPVSHYNLKPKNVNQTTSQ